MSTRPSPADTGVSDTGRFVIVGAGAVGSHIAQALHENGVSLAVIDADEKVRAAWSARGVETLKPGPGSTGQGWQRADVAVLATKATIAAQAVASLPDNMPVIAISNGIVTRAELGENRPLSWGVVDFAADVAAPGVSECTHKGGLQLGTDGSGDAPARLVRALAGSAVPAELNEDIQGYRWSKLILNAAFEPLGAVSGLTFGDIFAHPPSRRVLQVLLAEGVAVARASGIVLQPVHGNSPATLSWVLSLPLIAQIAAFFGAREARGIEGNMLIDLRHGARTEVDYFNGHIVRSGAEASVPTPTHSRILDMVHLLEEGVEKPARDRAAALLA